ncbi:uncharacterized protein BP01DRAFT_184554 [Aspergillus saccharolyticus JOP 1030-1]|uniref:Uncharacterized protein n=1 Tax=Aspergillus saccharolyticus JOP 1030-1 TaxID=1450539 RepID=A0A318Z4A3_9EURO|nr:hypothetical protein BP01DRAFT_184554 [Aspergillus saccharolyticus JOP 1030-1]PYH41254.1 hypothetical protein BP01DRAFT_184554 [Aspergillus saccharolyticus JOP 1030-1]
MSLKLCQKIFAWIWHLTAQPCFGSDPTCKGTGRETRFPPCLEIPGHSRYCSGINCVPVPVPVPVPGSAAAAPKTSPSPKKAILMIDSTASQPAYLISDCLNRLALRNRISRETPHRVFGQSL